MTRPVMISTFSRPSHRSRILVSSRPCSPHFLALLGKITKLTTEPSKFYGQFHNRIPLIIEPDKWDLWLNGSAETAAALMKPANEEVLVSRPVNKAVGNVKNNGPELLT